ncbi:MAG: hypothetical protein H7233_02780 [Pseudorhodobacter sp.]|nr:hypothetical protein [Frankiaceae bacterium]
MISYLDTSAVAKLLADEVETNALRAHLDDRVASGDADLVSAFLLENRIATNGHANRNTTDRGH